MPDYFIELSQLQLHLQQESQSYNSGFPEQLISHVLMVNNSCAPTQMCIKTNIMDNITSNFHKHILHQSDLYNQELLSSDDNWQWTNSELLQ